jgi:hypothetical protein
VISRGARERDRDPVLPGYLLEIEMKAGKLIEICANMTSLMALHRQAADTMCKMIYAVAQEHLKENNVRQTLDERSATRAALRMWVGESKVYAPEHGQRAFYSKAIWPTHIRIWDLKPVRVRNAQSIGSPDGNQIIVRDSESKTVAKITPTILEKEYIQIREEE